jgi:DNA ligase-1
MRERHVQSFNTLQQRLNRKTVTTKKLREFPAHLRAYDFLFDNEGDVRDRPFVERRARLEALIGGLGDPRIDVSAIIRFATWQELAAARGVRRRSVPARMPRRSKA